MRDVSDAIRILTLQLGKDSRVRPSGLDSLPFFLFHCSNVKWKPKTFDSRRSWGALSSFIFGLGSLFLCFGIILKKNVHLDQSKVSRSIVPVEQ